MRERDLNPIDVYLGAQVASHRQRLRLSPAQLAYRLRVPRDIIIPFEAGRERMSWGVLYRLSEIFDVPFASFFKGSPLGITLVQK